MESTVKQATVKRKRRSVLTDSERKRRRTALVSKMNTTRIVIGGEFSRWRALRKKIGLKSDTLTAKFLLDRYYSDEKGRSGLGAPTAASTNTPVNPVPGTSGVSTSTPATKPGDNEKTLTGVETLPESESENGQSRKKTPLKRTKSGRVWGKTTSGSFLDPFELSVDVSVVDELDETEIEDSDSDYEPQQVLTAILSEDVNRQTEDVTLEELEFDLERDEEDLLEEESEDTTGFTPVTTEEECQDLPYETTCLVFLRQILNLADCMRESCKVCGATAQLEHNFVGSALYLKWVCEKNHLIKKWCSQPVLNRRLHSGDFLTALCIVSSGNNYGKIALLAKMLNLKLLSASTFHRIQSTYLIPSVDSLWTSHQQSVHAHFNGKDLIVAGDGRMDSPGHSAQYCTYTIMEHDTKTILYLKTLDKRETERKSVNMEKKGFEQSLNTLQEKGLSIKEVVTDAHMGIGALMKSQYPNIKHSNDIWHAAKNLGKKILKAGQKKNCGILLKWSKDVINHFWYACKTANSYPEFMSIWRSVLHHITNQHSWALSHGHGVNHCHHGPLSAEERDKPWLDPSKDSEALSALTGVILDKRFLNRIDYMLNFRSTAELEVFNQLILMYSAKRYAYSPPAYRMRNLLAALDHNKHLDRPLKRNAEGNIVYNRYFNKKSGRWSVHPVKEQKSYQHIKELARIALSMRLNDKIGMKRKRELEPEDPRRISTHLAPIPPPPTEQLVEEKISRFQKDAD